MEPAESKPPEYWLISFRNIVESALSVQAEDIEDMCNAIKTSSPETIEMSKQQHIETMEKIGALVEALNVGLRAFYILIAALLGIGLIGLGTILFAASIIISK